jgi:hypothetical protein
MSRPDEPPPPMPCPVCGSTEHPGAAHNNAGTVFNPATVIVFNPQQEPAAPKPDTTSEPAGHEGNPG